MPPERPEGSGPHIVLPEFREPEPPVMAGGSPSPSVGADGEPLDPTMSQMWYADGEAEAAEQLAEYQAYQKTQLKGRLDPDLTDPVLPGVTVEEGEATLFMRVKRARRVLLLTIGVVVVMVAVTMVLLSRRRGDGGSGSDRKLPPGFATMAAGGNASGVMRRAPARPDGGARDVDAGPPTLVVDMAVHIDVEEPMDRMNAMGSGRRRRRPPPVMGMTVSKPDAGAAADAIAATRSGRQSLARGNIAAAKIEFQRALTVRPGYGPALAGLGEALFEQGRYTSAISKLRAACRSMPASVRTWVLLGNACFRAGRYTSARAAYKTALRMRPGHAEARKNLGLVEKKLGGMSGM
jgi:tetratricopeptide (TPR) repeat protein